MGDDYPPSTGAPSGAFEFMQGLGTLLGLRSTSAAEERAGA
jgi:hypothetical protein